MLITKEAFDALVTKSTGTRESIPSKSVAFNEGATRYVCFGPDDRTIEGMWAIHDHVNHLYYLVSNAS